MNVRRISRPVLSDDEVAAAMAAEDKTQDEIEAVLAERRAARAAVQGEYNTKPPTTRYQET
jgi:hypothetical protein